MHLFGSEVCMGIPLADGERLFVRSPKRLTITIPFSTFEKIISRSNEEGRSLSNLAAYLLERGVEQQ
jgi:hypothetical protein